MDRETLEAIPGPRKAAILMITLGPEAARPLLQSMPRAAVAKIAAEAAQLTSIDSELADAVLEDYVNTAVRPKTHHGGRDVARRLLTLADVPENQQAEILGIRDEREDPTSQLLAPLLEAAPEALAAILADEQPQTAALVLLNLTPAKAARVLAGLPEAKRAEALQRMTSLRPVRGEILDEVAATIHARLQDPSAVADADEADGLQRTAEVLKSMKRSEVRSLLGLVEKDDPERATELRKIVNTFDTLELADDRGIQELLRIVDTKTLCTALHGEEDSLLQRFLGNLSERAAGIFREEMEFLGKVRPADVTKAQNEIMEHVLTLEQEEKLIFEEPAEAEE